MNLFNTIENWLFGQHNQQSNVSNDVNPANGLPMINDSVDIKGNPYATDFNNDHSGFSSSHDDFFKNDHNDFDGGFGGGGFGGFD